MKSQILRILPLFLLVFALAAGKEGSCCQDPKDKFPSGGGDDDTTDTIDTIDTTDTTDTTEDIGEGEGYLCVIVQTSIDFCSDIGPDIFIQVMEDGAPPGKEATVSANEAKIVCCGSAEITYCMYRYLFALELDKLYYVSASVDGGIKLDTVVFFNTSMQPVCIPIALPDPACVCECEPVEMVDGECQWE
jgi:hypothetical protein